MSYALYQNNYNDCKHKEISALPNKIYQDIVYKSIIPTLVVWFNEIKLHNSLEIKANLLSYLGEQRNLISMLCRDTDSENFGKLTRIFYNTMNDPVSKNEGWQGWNNLVIGKVTSLFNKIMNDSINRDKWQLWQGSTDKNIILSENESNICLEFSKKGYGFYRSSIDDINNPDQTKIDYGSCQLYKTMVERESAYYEFNFRVDENNQIKFTDVICTHRPPNQKNIDQINQDVIDVITSDNISLENLQQKLLSALWEFSHSSIYHRGQAANTKILLEALANFLKYNLKFSVDWTPPNPNYDQQALSYLDKNEFTSYGREHLHLNKIDCEYSAEILADNSI